LSQNTITNSSFTIAQGNITNYSKSQNIHSEHFKLSKNGFYLLIDGNESSHLLRERLDPIIYPVKKLKGCMEGTRTKLLDDLCEWVLDPRTTIAWIHGIAGTGKSAIAVSFARRLRDMEKVEVALTFHCVKGQETGNPSKLVPTICYQLALACARYRNNLANMFSKDVSLIATGVPISEQLQRLLSPAILDGISNDAVIVILIDGLDEWGAIEDRQVLLQHLNNLDQVTWLKLVLTSRPHKDIREELSLKKTVTPFNLTNQYRADKDIALVIKASLQETSSTQISKEDINKLITKANGLFIWAVTALSFIKNGVNKAKRLATLLGLEDGIDSPYHQLYMLYEKVIQESFSDIDNLEYFKVVMGMVLAVKEPMSLHSLSHILAIISPDLSSEVVSSVLERLSAVVYYRDKKLHYHLSFGEFLCSKIESSKLYIGIDKCHFQMVGACLKIMKRELRFNICSLETSFVKNDAIENPPLEERVQKCISAHLQYSCVHWTYHLSKTEKYSDVSDGAEVTTFMNSKWLIYWLECMSLMKMMYQMKNCLREISTWAQRKVSIVIKLYHSFLN